MTQKDLFVLMNEFVTNAHHRARRAFVLLKHELFYLLNGHSFL